MIKRNHWAVPGFSALALMTLAACSGGGGGGGGGAAPGGTPGTGAGGGTPPAVDFATPNPYATNINSDTPDKLGTLYVFGDSYSNAGRSPRDCSQANPIPGCVDGDENWSRQLVASVPGAQLSSYAREGASALTGGAYNNRTNDFKNQVDQWVAGKNLAANDLSIVFLGYNDVNALPDQSQSIVDYETQVQRLIAEGATAQDRRLFLTLIHDFGAVPKAVANPNDDFSRRTDDMNAGIAQVVGGKQNVVAVDMFTVFNRIAADPARYGLTNVTDAVPTGADPDDYLYSDGDHFGARGQTIMAQVYNHYLTRGWDLANSLQGSTANKDQLNDDVDDRLAELNGLDATRTGFSTFFVGNEQAARGAYDMAAGDPTRAGFAERNGASHADAGIGLNYAIDASTRFGLVMSRYGNDDAFAAGTSSTRLDTESDAISVYLDSKAGLIDLRTRASYSDDRYRKATFDSLVGEAHGANHGGKTMSISQTASTAIRLGYSWLQPWVNVTHSRQETDGYTISNAYLSDLTYSGTEASETMASLGLNATTDRFAIGHDAGVRFSGGLSYTRSLAMNDYEVSIREAAVAGLSQTETVERDNVEMVGLKVASELDMGESLSFSADYALTKQMGVDADHAITARFNYRF